MIRLLSIKCSVGIHALDNIFILYLIHFLHIEQNDNCAALVFIFSSLIACTCGVQIRKFPMGGYIALSSAK